MPSVSITQQQLSLGIANGNTLQEWSDATILANAVALFQRFETYLTNGFPLAYRLKEVVITDTNTPNYTAPPTVAIGGGSQFTGGNTWMTFRNAVVKASIVGDDGLKKSYVTKIVVQDPGEYYANGFSNPPTVVFTINAVSDTSTTAIAIMEVDPVATQRRNFLFECFKLLMGLQVPTDDQAGVRELVSKVDAIGKNSMNLDTTIRSKLQELIAMFDPNQVENLGSVVKGIESGVSDVLREMYVEVTGVSGDFKVGERVSTSTGSGNVILYDSIESQLVIGHVVGEFLDAQAITGASSGTTATTVVQTVATGASNDQISRAMMVMNLKATNKLEDLRKEIKKPTSI